MTDTLEPQTEHSASHEPLLSSKGHHTTYEPDNDSVGCYLSWRNINFVIPNATEDGQSKQILFNIDGDARPGEIFGIIGSSGGGKTTLLSLISGRSNYISSLSSISEVSGTVKINRTECNLDNKDEVVLLKNAAAFVMQEDILLATETAREAIRVSALLRIDANKYSYEERLLKADNIIKDMDLLKCADTYVGSHVRRGLSGGEKKRVSIGVELVTNPNLLMLDEPTSGLDSVIAFQTISRLKDMANDGKTIITTIHQPSSETFALIDRLMVLCKGYVVYYGERAEMVSYFTSLGYECPRYSNSADYVLQQIHDNPDFFIESWKKVGGEWVKKQEVDDADKDEIVISEQRMAVHKIQIPILFARAWRTFSRDSVPTFVRLAQTIVAGLLQGALWWDLDTGEDDHYNRFGCTFFCIVTGCMGALTASNLTFPAQRLIFEKERVSGWYNTGPYIVAKTLVALPQTWVITAIYVTLIKWMVQFEAPWEEMVLSIGLSAAVADSMGFAIGCIAGTTEIALQITPVAIIPLMLFCNFFVQTSQIPSFLRWIKWIDMFFYGVESLSISEFANVDDGWDFLDDRDVDPSASRKRFDWWMLFVLFLATRLTAIVYLLIKTGL